MGRCGFSKIPPGQGRNIRPGVPAAMPLEVRGKQGTLARRVPGSLEKVDLSHLTGGCWPEHEYPGHSVSASGVRLGHTYSLARVL